MRPKIRLARLVATFVIFCIANNGFYVDSEITLEGDGGRMEGGTEAPKHAYPYLVVMQNKIGKEYVGKCNGVLIDDDTILLPAIDHCLEVLAEKTRALAGTYNSTDLTEYTRQIRDVCFTEVHKSNSGYKNAYMFVHLCEPFHLNEYVRAVALPRIKNVAKVDGDCIVAGRFNHTGKIFQKFVKLMPCKQSEYTDKTVICTDFGPCNDHGAILLCTRGNREFVAGQYIRSYCTNNKDTAYTSFLSIDYKWLDEMKKKAVKKCRSFE